eukprot:366537-Chlamydomonas_euryale.AAC.2
MPSPHAPPHTASIPQAVQLLAVGGCDASWRSLRSAEVYDPVVDAWSPGPSLASGVSFAGCANMQRRGGAWLVGGTPMCSQVRAEFSWGRQIRERGRVRAGRRARASARRVGA